MGGESFEGASQGSAGQGMALGALHWHQKQSSATVSTLDMFQTQTGLQHSDCCCWLVARCAVLEYRVCCV